jgi:hypothetical protein
LAVPDHERLRFPLADEEIAAAFDRQERAELRQRVQTAIDKLDEVRSDLDELYIDLDAGEPLLR